MSGLLPSSASLAHRARIAESLRPLRRVQPRVPFYQLAAHRIPTLWHLYRGLLKYSPTEQIRWRVSQLFRQHHHLTSPKAAVIQLQKGYKLLGVLEDAKLGDARLQAILRRYSRLIDVRVAKTRMDGHFEQEMKYQEQLRNRPILTGGFIRPTLYNKPLPRMKPQPNHVSMMIRRRRDARQRRVGRFRRWEDWRSDLLAEQTFEAFLKRRTRSGGTHFDFMGNDWMNMANGQVVELKNISRREEARSRMKISPELWKIVKAARQEKIANKTREKERAGQGYVSKITEKKMRRGLPAALLSRVSPKTIRRDKVIKRPDEGGYTGLVKKSAGMKLKHDTSAIENGATPEAASLEARIMKESAARSAL